MLLDAQVGPRLVSPGSENPLRAARSGALVTCDAHARYAEAIRTGNCYYATAVAASLGTALTATGVTLTLYNPQNSSVYLSVLHVGVALTTPPAAAAVGALVLAANVNPITAVPATNTLAANWGNALLGASPGRGVGQPYTATTLPAAPIAVRNLGGWAFVGTAASSTGFPIVNDEIAGMIMLAPNTAVTVQGILSASSWTGTVTMVWEEIPINA